jgi:hypothetical protein
MPLTFLKLKIYQNAYHIIVPSLSTDFIKGKNMAHLFSKNPCSPKFLTTHLTRICNTVSLLVQLLEAVNEQVSKADTAAMLFV